MTDIDLAVASCRVLPEPDPDAAPLAAALAKAGLRAEVLAWDDPEVDWSRARACVLRSTWNYPEHPQAFRRWCESCADQTQLWNPLSAVTWNLHKGYLLDLEAAGVPTTPTELVGEGSTESLASILARRAWDDVVVKPAVSAGSYCTQRVRAAEGEVEGPGEAHLRALAARGDVLIQLYLQSVEDYGERALVWIDGELSHAVRKTVRWAGQDEQVSEAQPISDAEAALAERALAVVEGELLYARVDVAPGPDGPPLVMELELIEPSLFFPQRPAALERYVDGIVRRLQAL